MPILAVTLFGSRARGDAKPNSDIDVLLITEEGKPRHTSMGNISLSFYPLKDLEARARSGNLFLCHVLQEGCPLHDPDGLFDKLKAGFRLRQTYAGQIQHAAALAWLLVRFGNLWAETPLLRRRITWAVRTILIAKSAEAGTPTFAPARLAQLGPHGVTRRLIAAKDARELRVDALSSLKRFLIALDLPDPLPEARDPGPYRQLFMRTHNAVGQHFLTATDPHESSSYE